MTPFDRSQILDLITALDDTIDLMKDTGRRMMRYGVGLYPGDAGHGGLRGARRDRDSRCACRCWARSTAAPNGWARCRSRSASIEGEADDLLDRGLRVLFAGDTSPGYKLTVEKVYDLVEAVVDRCEDVSNVIDGIVVEQV